jgi:hypothetical protein
MLAVLAGQGCQALELELALPLLAQPGEVLL